MSYSTMSFITWKAPYSLCGSDLDRQHRRLMEAANRLGDAISVGAPKQVIQAILADFAAYAGLHFRTEDQLMVKSSYPACASHRTEHQSFLAWVAALERDIVTARASAKVPFPDLAPDLDSMKSWLQRHMFEADAQLAVHLQDRLDRDFQPPAKSPPATGNSPGPS